MVPYHCATGGPCELPEMLWAEGLALSYRTATQVLPFLNVLAFVVPPKVCQAGASGAVQGLQAA